MQVMENRMSTVLILVVAAGLLFLVKTNEKKMGEDVSMIVMLLVVLAALYGLFVVKIKKPKSHFIRVKPTASRHPIPNRFQMSQP